MQVAPLAPDSARIGRGERLALHPRMERVSGRPGQHATTQAGTWLLAGAPDELTGALTARLASGGFSSRDANGNLESAITAAAGDPGGCAGVIFVAEPATESSGSSSGPARAALELATRLSRHVGADRPRLWFVTRGSQPVVEHERVSCEHAAVWGIGRTFAEEHPGLWGGLIDVDPAVHAGVRCRRGVGERDRSRQRRRPGRVSWRPALRAAPRARHHRDRATALACAPMRPMSSPAALVRSA